MIISCREKTDIFNVLKKSIRNATPKSDNTGSRDRTKRPKTKFNEANV